jgi:hypothetical protein
MEDKMQKWKYCILEYETFTKESKSSSKEVIKLAKAKIHYFRKETARIERLFKYIYPKEDEISNAIAYLGDKGWKLIESKSTKIDNRTITKYHFKRPLRLEINKPSNGGGTT